MRCTDSLFRIHIQQNNTDGCMSVVIIQYICSGRSYCDRSSVWQMFGLLIVRSIIVSLRVLVIFAVIVGACVMLVVFLFFIVELH